MPSRFDFNANRHSQNKDYQLWTHENQVVVMYSQQFAMETLEHQHNNPVRARLVQKPEHYVYSSAGNYAGMDSLLDVILLDLKWKTYH